MGSSWALRFVSVVCSALFILLGVRMTVAGSGAKQKSARGGVQWGSSLSFSLHLQLGSVAWHSSPFCTHSHAQIHNHCFLKDRKWGRLPVTVLFHVVTSWCLVLLLTFFIVPAVGSSNHVYVKLVLSICNSSTCKGMMTCLLGFPRLWKTCKYQGVWKLCF